MKKFVKIMCVMLSMLLIVSLVIACDTDNEEANPITTKEITTPIVTTTVNDTTTVKDTTTINTTTVNNTTTTTTEAPITTTNDGWGPLIPLDTGKNN